MAAGIVLVHGFSGAPEDFLPLTEKLAAVHGAEAVTAIRLPGHTAGEPLTFDRATSVLAIAEAVDTYRREGRSIVLLGHSTGGILALASLLEHSLPPDLLVLAAVPRQIDGAYLERWDRHRSGREAVPFVALAQVISLINTVGAQKMKGEFPVVVMHGADDDLVPCTEAFDWAENGFERRAHTVIVPAAGHDLFRGENSTLVVELVMRTVADCLAMSTAEDASTLEALAAAEPEVNRFLARSPASGRHIVRCPSGRTVSGEKPAPAPTVNTEPVFANIEITTRCNMSCSHCARTGVIKQGEDMDRETFTAVLGLLPHAYRITLVGLGEPLLHPDVVHFVTEASAQGRRTGLVTNAMLLEPSLSRELVEAGLDSIAFSIDGPTQELASDLRPGTDLKRMIANIEGFVEAAKSSRPVSTAVFSAISAQNISHLDKLIDLVSGLGVHVLMVSDLNFGKNIGQTLWQSWDEAKAAQVKSGVARSFQKGLPVLSVRGLEEFGLWKRYGDYLLFPPDQLARRSTVHTWCFSPWQTVPVNVRGEVSLCDCRPEVFLGSLLDRPLADIWNGPTMVEHRSRMLGADPPEACRFCPRF